mgnify:FL=1
MNILLLILLIIVSISHFVESVFRPRFIKTIEYHYDDVSKDKPHQQAHCYLWYNVPKDRDLCHPNTEYTTRNYIKLY